MKQSILLSLLTVTSVFAMAAWHFGTGAPPTTPAPAVARLVTLAAVESRDVPVSIDVSGTIVPLKTVDIRSLVSAYVREVAITDGQTLRPGDLLFTLDDRAVKAELDRARAQLQRDKTSLADLDRQLQRARDLHAQNFIAQSAVDSAMTQREVQHAAVSSALSAVRAGDVNMSYSILRAPFAGRAGKVSVHPGGIVSPTTEAPLVTISQMDPIGVSFAVPQAQLASRLALTPDGPRSVAVNGSPVMVLDMGADTGCARPDDAIRAVAAGRVDFVDNAIDTATGTIRMRGSFGNPELALWPGQHVKVRLQLAMLKGVSVVPQAAILAQLGNKSVYVASSDGSVQLRPVRTGFAQGAFVVVDGVKPGERIVVEGKQNLRPGSVVKESPSAIANPALTGYVGGASANCLSAASAADPLPLSNTTGSAK